MSPTNLHVVLVTGDGPGQVRWQVRAANGRTICRSGGAFPDAANAVAAFGALQPRLAGLTLSLTHPPTGLGWVWSLTDRSGEALVVAARSYERRGTCVNAYRHFVRFAPDLVAATAAPGTE